MNELKMGKFREYLRDSRNGYGVSYMFKFPNIYGAHVCNYNNDIYPSGMWRVRLIRYREDGCTWGWLEHNLRDIPYETDRIDDEEVCKLLEKLMQYDLT